MHSDNSDSGGDEANFTDFERRPEVPTVHLGITRDILYEDTEPHGDQKRRVLTRASATEV